MGNQLSTDTLCFRDVKGHSYWVGVDWKSFTKGDNKKCYHGCLIGRGPRSSEKVVVKAFKEQLDSKSYWRAAELTSATANEYVELFNKQLHREMITINIPSIVLMDSVSKMNEIFGSRSRSRSLNDNEWVGIEELITGKFARYCSTSPCAANQRSSLMETFSHYTYQRSGGVLVVCDFQGNEKGGYYHLTNPVIHSQNSSFGVKDVGVRGINEFFKMHRCNDICRRWLKMCPLSPPPSFDDICIAPPVYHLSPSAPPIENDG